MTWELAGAWEWKPLGSVLTPVRTQVKPDEIHDDWTYVGLEHVVSASGEYQGIEAGSANIKSNKFLFDEGDVLYGKLRPNLRKCAVALSRGVCSTDLVPLRPVEPEAAYLIAMQLRSEPFTAQVMRLIGGANLPRVNLHDLFSLAVPVPPDDSKSRLYAMARAVSSLRVARRRLEDSVDELDSAVTAHALGLV